MTDPSPDEAPPYRVSEVAEELGVCEQTVRSALKSGEIRGTRLRGIWLIPRNEIARVKGGGA